MAPIGPRHAAAVSRLTRLLVAAADEAAIEWVQNPLRLSGLSEPQPDVALLRPRADFSEGALPAASDALLVIEVSDTTADFDRSTKRPLYAAAGISEVWIVDLPEPLIEIATVPTGETCSRIRQLSDGTVTPSLLPEISISISEPFG
jgi:Uma2 family endonuclease